MVRPATEQGDVIGTRCLTCGVTVKKIKRRQFHASMTPQEANKMDTSVSQAAVQVYAYPKMTVGGRARRLAILMCTSE